MSKANAIFDDMCWPIPNGDLAWKLRYGNPDRSERLQAAAHLEAYAHLIEHTQKRRNYICQKIKEVMADPSTSEEFEK